jgi:Predicted ATPase
MSMHIEYVRLQNFKSFQNAEIRDLPGMCVFVGANGVGKTTLFDAFGFLKDSLQNNVRQALAKRGGFREVVSRGQSGPIEIEIKFREDGGPLATYMVQVDLDHEGKPIVSREILKFRRGAHGQPWHFLDFSNGQGVAIVNEGTSSNYETIERKDQQLDAPDILAIKGLGQLKEFRTAAAFRRLIENWHVSDFHVDDARISQEAGYAEHLSSRGDNAALVAQYMYEHHRDQFDAILDRMKLRVPGVSRVEATATEDGRIVLRFQDGNFVDPFIGRFVSDGTIKMFSYLLLLHDPRPHPLLCVEEPENQLYPTLMSELAEEFRDYAERGGQVFVSTHSPDFLNGCNLEEVFWLQKENGYTTIHRAIDNQLLRDLIEGGDKPGWLWKQGLFDGADPQ